MRPAVVTACLLLATSAVADCDAPGLSFPKRSGALLGFAVTKLVGVAEVNAALAATSTVIPFGDDHFSLARLHGESRPQEVAPDTEAVSRTLLENIVPGPFYPGGEAQQISIHRVSAFDLNGDLDADLILFEVSPGANIYSGAVGVEGNQWFTLVEPTCY